MADAKAQNRYRVIDRLESGGMAEVFRGESESVAGFKKSVAIKRVLPHLASNEKFIRMFLDEARLSARLTHANIVQVFDIGHVENTYFIVMEFIDGVNLKGAMEHLRNRKVTMSLPIACFITQKVCEGLHYAHEATDSEGGLLNIVHRDISPPNVLLSKRGEVKIVDFGLAKAAHSVEKTEPGIVKGKFSYLAPETAMGQDADPQADIFAVGIMLWEMLAGRKLFQGDTDYQTVKLVQQAVVPSIRSINPAVPEALEAILKQALSRDKAHRFQTAQLLGEELSGFLFANKLRVSSVDIGKLVGEVVSEKQVNVKRDGKSDGSVINQFIQEELFRFTSLGEPVSGPSSTQRDTPATAGEGAQPLDANQFVSLSNWASDAVGDDDGFDPDSLGNNPSWNEISPGLSQSSPNNLADALEGDADDDSELPPPPPTRSSSVLSSSSLPLSIAQAIQHPPPVAASSPPGSATASMPPRKFTQLNAPPAQKKFPTVLVAVITAILVVGVSVGLVVTHVIHIP